MGFLTALTLFLSLFVVTSCYRAPETMSQKRTDYARKAVGDIVIAVFDDSLDGSYVDGIRLVVDRLNMAEGGLLGRPVKLFIEDGSGDYDSLRSKIRRVADNPKIIAVLGHRYSGVAVPASVIYEDAKLLFISPFATSSKLTAHNFKFVLRGLPDGNEIAAQTADIASLFGYERLAVLRARDDYNRNAAFSFEDEVRKTPGIDVVFRGSFFSDQDNYRTMLGQLKGIDFDALYLATPSESGERVIKQLRELGLNHTILGSDSLFGRYEGVGLARLADNAADRTIVPVIYQSKDVSYRNRQFIKNFKKAYGYLPKMAAAQGYNSMSVLADIVKRAGTTNPEVLATTAHWSPPIASLSGIRAYDTSGNIYGMRYQFNILRFGEWLPLPAVNLPYAFNKFRTAQKQYMETITENKRGERYPLHASADTAEPANVPRKDVQEVDKNEEKEKNNQEKLQVYEGPAERFQRNFALAHELIGFTRLGFVLGHTQSSKDAESLISIAAEKMGFKIERCKLPNPYASLDLEQQNNPINESNLISEMLRKALVACYSSLFRTIDAIFVVTDIGVEPSLLSRLNRNLLNFDIPSFAINESLSVDYGLSMVVNTPKIGLDDPTIASRFDRVLKNMEVRDLNRKLSKLSTVATDLSILESDLLSRDQLIIVSEVLDPELANEFKTSDPTAKKSLININTEYKKSQQ